LFGRHTCTSSYMLCPNTKFLTVSASHKSRRPFITAVPNILQNGTAMPNILRNTPAMPMVASAAKHKLSGFFMPGSFSA
ncbi:hypothetical protein, partial [Pseudomonas savastanoi]|uniref:hypothetical protein n=3 Tax=Pseudomonas savastanoi TaxID=29438 RepID=UPI001C0F5067